MINPVIAEVMRGGIVESRHRGAFAVVDAKDHVVAAEGGIAAAVFPRSAIKAFQCLAVVESGAADRFGFTAGGDRTGLFLAQRRARACARRPRHAGQGGQWRGAL